MRTGSINSKIVGVQYYRGHVTFGEMVILQREPHNQYDRNAIQVLNVSGIQIGHIPRQIALKLAPFMDSRKLLCEAETTGPKGGYDVPISIKLMGTNDPSARAVLKEEMKAVKLPVEELLRQEREEKAREKARLAAKKEQEKLAKAAKKAGLSMPGSQGPQSLFRGGTGDFAGGSFQATLTPDLADIIKDSVRFNPRNVDQMVEQFGMKDDDLAKMDKADQPAMVETQLLPYQLQVRTPSTEAVCIRGILETFQCECKLGFKVMAPRIAEEYVITSHQKIAPHAGPAFHVPPSYNQKQCIISNSGSTSINFWQFVFQILPENYRYR